MGKTLFKTGGLFLLLAPLVFMFLIFGCSPAGLNLIRQLEARDLKDKAIEKREICFHDFVSEENINQCYMDEVYSLIADECINIRRTEPMNQENCENLLYNIIMRPNTLAANRLGINFPTANRNTDSLHPGGRGVECADDPACLVKCQDIFNTSLSKNRCYDYSVSAVNLMYDVFGKLNNPSASNLNSISSAATLRYLRILFNISTDETLGALDVWGNDQYKIARKWIADYQTVADVFFKIDKKAGNRKLASYFFNNSASTLNTYFSQFNASLTSSTDGDNVLDIMLERRNESGLLWIHDILSEVHGGSDGLDSTERTELMLDYCKIDFHSRNERSLFNYVFFKDLLSSILQEQIPLPAPSWWTAEAVAVDLDSDQWWDDDRVNAVADEDIEDRSVCEFILPPQTPPSG